MESQWVRVAVGIVFDDEGRVLLSQRGENTHLAGLWEFPGGKFEPQETSLQALDRELHEELGIEVLFSEPLIVIRHEYPEKCVELDVRLILKFRGQAEGKEGQALQWVEPERLQEWPLPAADELIIEAILKRAASRSR